MTERYTQRSVRGESTKRERERKDERFLIVINPVSRGGNALKEGMWLLKELRKLNIDHEAFVTQNPGHATTIVERWVNSVDCVVAVGGDGTANEVVNGIKSGGGDRKTFCVFPAGTADDYCHNVGIPRNRSGALDVMLNGRDRKIDLLKYNGRFAVVQLGVGVDAEIAYRTLSHKKIRIPAYFAVGLRIVFIERLQRSARRMRIEGENGVHEGRFLVAVFGNAPLYARYVYWMPEARMDDGIINMSAVGPMSPIPAWFLFLRCFNRDYRSDRIIYDSGRRFKVFLEEESFIQVDGEVYKYASGETLDISIEPLALKVRVPSETPIEAPFVNP